MNRKDKHINKFLRDPLPNPEVPADDAWADMSDMLGGQADAPSVDNTGQGANIQGPLSSVWKAVVRFKGLLTGISVVSTLAVISLIVLNAEITNNGSTVNQSANISDTASQKAFSEAKSTGTAAAERSPAERGPAERGAAERPLTGAEQTETPTVPIAATGTSGTERAATADANAKGAIVLENSHTKVPGKRSKIPADNVVRIGTGRADVTRPTGSYKPTSASARERNPHSGNAAQSSYRGALTDPGAGQDHAFSQVQLLSTGKAVPEAVSSSSPSKNTQTTPEHISINSLKPLSGHFESAESDLSKFVQMPALPKSAPPVAKAHNRIWEDIHFGPEWTVNRAIATTEYIFTGADSIKHPWRLAIPGLFVSKSWNRHSATIIFNPLHAYFDEKERINQRIDTIRVTDSIVNIVYHNANFIKALGINFTLQYQYQAAKWLSLVGGLSYARYSAALLRKEMEFRGNVFPEEHLTVRGRETLGSYIRPQQWNIRVGLLSGWPGVLDGRLQVGFNVIIPVSSLSLDGFKRVKSPNAQMSLRFLIK